MFPVSCSIATDCLYFTYLVNDSRTKLKEWFLMEWSMSKIIMQVFYVGHLSVKEWLNRNLCLDRLLDQ